MTTATGSLLLLGLYFVSPAFSQQTSAFNQNASRSNHTRLGLMADSWNFGFNTGMSFATQTPETALFRGKSMYTRVFANYFFDQLGLGISSGLLPGTIGRTALNDFMAGRKFPVNDVLIESSKPFNSYMLAGPAFRFGNRVVVQASVQGGVFVNDPGAVSIRQRLQGGEPVLYSYQPGSQKINAGLSGSIQLAFPINGNTQFFVNSEYLRSATSVRVLDPLVNPDVPMQQSRELNLLTAGIGITRSFGGRQSAKKRSVGNSTGSCGPVIRRVQQADGSVEEMEFACLDDAAAFVRATGLKSEAASEPSGKTKAQDHNSSRSNKTASITSPTPDSTNQVQDHNSSRSNKSSAIDAPDPGNGSNSKAQDHNSSRSNKTASSVSVDADLDGDGVYETDLTQTLKDEIRIDEKGELVEMPSQKAGVSTSRSNIRSHAKLQAIGNNLYICHATAEIDKKLVPVKIIYK